MTGLSEDCTDIFLSQISMLTDWDVLMLQACFRQLDGVNVGAHELFTPPELLGGLRCPAVIVNQKRSGQSKIAGGCGKMDCGRAGPHKGKKLGKFEALLMEIQEFVSGTV